jgi:Fe-S-cluster containining protein
MSALMGLPGAVFAVLPELRDLQYDAEPRADCTRCVLLPENSGADPTKLWAFNSAARCCTYKPRMANYLIGRGLWRGGRGAKLLMARLAEPAGVTSYGLERTEEEEEAFRGDMLTTFGHDERLLCPFYVGWENSCGIWPDRPGVCRTWFCKHERGHVGRSHWMMLYAALWGVEQALTHSCVGVTTPPEPGSPPEHWAWFYRWCTERVDRMTESELAYFRDHENIQEAREHLGCFETGPDPIPARVCTSVRGYEEDNGLVYLWSYTTYDGVRAPRTVFTFLSRLDGTRTWRQALKEANAELDEPLSEELVRELFRIGAIRDPEPGDFRTEESDFGVVVQLDPEKSWREQSPGFFTR